jgi:hypothetical protein
VTQGLLYVASLVDGADEKGHDVIEVRVVGLEGNVVVPGG